MLESKQSIRIDGDNMTICDKCIHEDIGYCDLRSTKIEPKYTNDKDGNLTKCSCFKMAKRFEVKK